MARSPHRAVSDATLSTWNRAKSLSCRLAQDLEPYNPAISQQLHHCQDWLTFRWTMDGEPSVWKTSRCRHRLCPVCRLADERKRSFTVDIFAREMVGNELFLTLMGRGSYQQHIDAWRLVRDRSYYRTHVLGALCARHLLPKPTARVPLRTRNLRGGPEITGINCHSHAVLQPVDVLDVGVFDRQWQDAAAAVGMTHARIHCSEVRNPAAAVVYILRPFPLTGVDPSDLLAMAAIVHNSRTYTFSGEFAGFWSAAAQEAKRTKPEWKDNSVPLCYEWDDDAYEITPPE